MPRLPHSISWTVLLAAMVSLFSLPVSAQIRDGGIDPWNLGKGEWIYFMSDATNKMGGNIPSVTSNDSLMKYYKSHGIRYIIIKAATNDKLFNGTYGSPQFNSALVNIAHANGLLIFGYNRSYGSNVVAEIGISDYVFNQGADGFVWDAEAEWESNQSWIGTNGPTKAWQLCSTVRSNWPTKFLAHAPFPIIGGHSSFPYKEFGYWCDAAMPQIYHFSSAGLKKSPSAAINWSDVNWKVWHASLVGSSSVINGQTIYWTNSIKPLAPIQDVYGPLANVSGRAGGVNNPVPNKDVLEFIDYLAADPQAITPGGYKGLSFWETALSGTVQWSYIQDGTSGNFSNIVNNIVMDDAKATVVGAWTAIKTFSATTTTPTFTGAYAGAGPDTNSFGTNYLVKGQGTGAAYIKFTPTVMAAGDYNIYQWNPTRVDASTNVPFLINHAAGSNTVYANQQTNYGIWSLLGRFPLAAGTNGNVRVLDSIPEASGVALVDGMKFVFVPPASVPSQPVGFGANTLNSSQIALSWNDNSTNETGFILARSTTNGGPYIDIATVGINTTHYTNSGLAANTRYYYVVRAVNYLGASTSSLAASAVTSPTVPTPPSVTESPQNQIVMAGATLTLSVGAAGSQPFSYQWFLNNTPVGGATNDTYAKANAQSSDAGNYFVVVGNAFGKATSSVARVEIHFSLTASVNGAGAVFASPLRASYIPNSTVTLTASPAPNATFTGWSGDASGTSNPLNVTLTGNKTITANFAGGTVADLILDNDSAGVVYTGSWLTGNSSTDKYGADYRYATATVTGASNVVYRPTITAAGKYDVSIWYPEGSNRGTNAAWSVFWNGGSSSTNVNQQVDGGTWVSIASAKSFVAGTNGYVRLSNAATTGKVVMADAIRFAYVNPPFISSPPASQAVAVGDDVTFSVVVTGASPFSYQWKWNGTNLAGGTGSSYLLSNVQTNKEGIYTVVITNVVGTVTSPAAYLTVGSTALEFGVANAVAGNQMHLIFNVDAGASFWIDRSTNLVEWQTVTNFFTTNGTVDFFDSFTTNRDKAFYRMRR